MVDFEKILDYMDGIIVLTKDTEAMEELEELFSMLYFAKSTADKIAALKLLEGWAYEHPKEMEQIKKQVEWKVMKNA